MQPIKLGNILAGCSKLFVRINLFYSTFVTLPNEPLNKPVMKKILLMKAWILAIIAGILFLLGIIAGLAGTKIIFYQWTYIYLAMAFTQFAILILLLSHTVKDKAQE
jgi:hypothetical protein